MFSSIYIYPVPTARMDDFLRVQTAALEIYREYGAHDDVTYRPVDTSAKYGCRGFDTAVELRDGEEPFVSVSQFRDRRHHDEVMAQVDRDPRIDRLFEEIQTVIDLERIVRGEFERAA